MTSKNEKPIIFKSEMVRAILNGTKTQTRRVIKPQPSQDRTLYGQSEGVDWKDRDVEIGIRKLRHRHNWTPSEIAERCPYGQPGDRLWVRETFSHYGNGCVGLEPVVAHVKYKADGVSMDRGSWPDFDAAIQRSWWNTGRFVWTPSIHMPRWASRINLEITGIRVEPVQEIGSGDAITEGVVPFDGVASHDEAEGWDPINEKRGYGWAENPWVWVVQFKVVR